MVKLVRLSSLILASFVAGPAGAQSEGIYHPSIRALDGSLFREPPIVTDIVNARVPVPTQFLRLHFETDPPPNTMVRWTSVDGADSLDDDVHFVPQPKVTTVEIPVAKPVVIFRDGGVGPSVIGADIGPPVNEHVTIQIRNAVGIGFGCYGFIASGPSVKIVDGMPFRATKADADIIETGPGNEQGVGPGYGCWGENFDPRATSYTLTFPHGGRLVTTATAPYVARLGVQDVATHGLLDVWTANGATYRLHLGSGAGTYFSGWIESSDRSLDGDH